MIFDIRDIQAYATGDNSDVVIGNIHFNLTTLKHWNYTLYSNGTLSNVSKCFLTFEPYTPSLLYNNGSFINATSCYSPVNPIGERAKIGIAFAVVFGLLLVANLVCLTKHGRRYLPAEKRFRPVGRRWQWYWGILTCAAAIISLLTNVDVDRYYVIEIPIVLTSFFWLLTEMCTLAIVWEAVRHWGSWQERQYIDPNPFVLPDTDRRYNFELIIPLVFYLFVWLNFFLVVPRNWGNIELQRTPEQAAVRAELSATDGRFKAAAFCLLVAWVVIVTSLRHSIRHYLPRNRGIVNRVVGAIGQTPLRLSILLILSLAMIAYQALVSFEWSYSVLNVHGSRVAIYLGGFAPSLLILLVQVAYGWLCPNEDRELIRQRRLRGSEADRELGIVPKPAWWRRINGDFNGNENMRDRIARNVREIGGGKATTAKIDRGLELRAAAAAAGTDGGVEMNAFSKSGRRGSLASTRTAGSAAPSFGAYGGKPDRRRHEQTMQAAASMLFPGSAATARNGPPPPYRDAGNDNADGRGRPRQVSANGERPGTSDRSNSTGTTVSLHGEPQQVRSMLDI